MAKNKTKSDNKSKTKVRLLDNDKTARMNALVRNEVETNVEIVDGENSLGKAVHSALTHLMKFREIGMTPVSSDKEIVDRLEKFFNLCWKTSQIPTIEKLCVVMGIDRRELTMLKNGTKRGFSPMTKDLINQAYTLISSVDADLVIKGEINPVLWIFRAKNFYDMVDKQEVTYTATNTVDATESVEIIEARYKELPPEE